MGVIASQITSLTIVFSAVYLGTDQRKHQSSASLAFVRGIHRRPLNSPHKWPVTRKMLPFEDVIMCTRSVSLSMDTDTNGSYELHKYVYKYHRQFLHQYQRYRGSVLQRLHATWGCCGSYPMAAQLSMSRAFMLFHLKAALLLAKGMLQRHTQIDMTLVNLQILNSHGIH